MALPRLVIVLSVASLLNDAASEMITPLLPLYLTGVLGAGAAVVGLVEGVAEAAASLLKYMAGRIADRGGGRGRSLVLGGYGLSCLARPAIGLATTWPAVLSLRFLDRAGKGLRTAPRDAFIAASVGEAERGHAFGFHRSMDHVGSIIGPLLATALLAGGMPLAHVFTASLLPGLLVVLLLAWGLRRMPAMGAGASAGEAVAAPVRLRWRELDARLRAMVLAAGALALAITPEAFLVLWATDNGLALALVPLLWSATSALKSLAAWLGGRLSDRTGRLPLLMAAWSLRIALLAALAIVPAQGIMIWVMFLLYGVSLALGEGPERALIGDVAPVSQRATAFGLYHLVYGLLALPGGILFGILWQAFGSGVAFALAALLTGTGMATMLLLARGSRRRVMS